MSSGKLTLVITDTSCLIVLDTIRQLELLPRLFNVVVTTPEVAAEYGKSLPAWLKLHAVKNHSLQDEISAIVDAGEASAIALAREIESDYIVIDDLQARKLAIKLGLTVISTLGILLKAKQSGLIPLLRPVLEQVKRTDFRVTVTLIEKVLRDCGE